MAVRLSFECSMTTLNIASKVRSVLRSQVAAAGRVECEGIFLVAEDVCSGVFFETASVFG